MSALSASLAAAAAAARATEGAKDSPVGLPRSRPGPKPPARPVRPPTSKPAATALRKKKPVKITVDTSVATPSLPAPSSATSAAAAAARSFQKTSPALSPHHRPQVSQRSSGESRASASSTAATPVALSPHSSASTVAAAASAAAKRSSTFNKSVPTPVVSGTIKREQEERAAQLARDMPSPSASVRSKRLSQSSLGPLSDEDMYSHRRLARSTQSFATIPTDEDSPGELGDLEDNNSQRVRGIQSAAKHANRLSQASMEAMPLQPVVSPHTGLPQEGSVLAAALKAGSNASSTMERISLTNEAKEREKYEKRQRKDAKSKAKLMAQANAVYQQHATTSDHPHHHQYHQGNIFKRVIGKQGKPIDPFQGFSPNFSERPDAHFHNHQKEHQGMLERKSLDQVSRKSMDLDGLNDSRDTTLDTTSSRELLDNSLMPRSSPVGRPIEPRKSLDPGLSDLPRSLDEHVAHLQQGYNHNNVPFHHANPLQTVKSSTDDTASIASMESIDSRPPLLAPIPIRSASIIPISSESESEDIRRTHRRHLSSGHTRQSDSSSQRNSLQFPLSPTFSASPAKQLITPEQLVPKRKRGIARTPSMSSSAPRSSSPAISIPLERSSTLQSTLQGSPTMSPVTRSPVFFESTSTMSNSPPEDLPLTPSESAAHSYFAREYRDGKVPHRHVEGASRLAKKLPHRHLAAGGSRIVKSLLNKSETTTQAPPVTGGMKTSLRKQPKKKFNEDKPWKHHADADTLTEAERKRYDGVWATNRGAQIPFYMEPEEYNLLVDEEELYEDGFTSDDSDYSDSDSDSVSSSEYIMSGDVGKDDVVVTDQNDAVHGYIVSRLWRRSRLPDERLSSIWDLVDRCNDGTLDREGFLVGMWLVDQCLYGRKLPNKVDPRVWGSVGRLNVNVKIRQKEPKRNSAKRRARRKLRRDRKDREKEKEKSAKERKKDEKKEKKDEKKERKDKKRVGDP